MATNLSIDPHLLAKALELSGERTRKAVVNRAPRESLARRKQLKPLEMFGQLEWSANYDYKRERSRP